MSYPFFIACRYLFTKKKERFISLSALISVLGIAIGVATLIVVLGVMSGFDKELKEKMLGINPPIIIQVPVAADAQQVEQKLGEISSVNAFSPFVQGQALIKSKDNVYGIILRGIDITKEARVSKIGEHLSKIKDEKPKVVDSGIILGEELKKNLRVNVGSEVFLVSPASRREHKFKVAGVFNCGMYDYDANFAFIGIKQAMNFFALSQVSGIGVKPNTERDIWKVKKEIQEKLSPFYSVNTWMDLNENFLSALKLEKTVMFIILSLVIVVACFNITSTLTMNVLEKTKDIGILKAIGASPQGIKAIFAFEGLIIGALGTSLGLGLGLGLGYLLENYQFIKLPRDIYYLDKIPVNIQFADVYMILFISFLIVLLSTIYPARQAVRLDPVKALRWE
ncbi:MAG: lipoprotein-releasing system transmembrane subunit LolC [Candidatus Aenigmatarchaeota archaeon]|nr:MAG: lipoprotein-releasing system transmembrane subunit LolC [Candidatus Aenigmarchaeota archaeon]